MKAKYILLSCLAFSLFFTSSTFAQSKKKLRAEISELNSENTSIKRQNQTLTVENNRLNQKNKLLENVVNRLKQDSAALSMDYKLLKEDYDELQASGGGNNAVALGGTSTSSTSYTPDPNDNRLCARKQSSLSPGASYFLSSLNKLHTHGWGVQVYSFSNLCQAVERAEEFSSYYRMFKTYIRVKEVNGQRVYSVVYGSLKDEAQARTYCENFRNIAKDEEGRSAFIVQH